MTPASDGSVGPDRTSPEGTRTQAAAARPLNDTVNASTNSSVVGSYTKPAGLARLVGLLKLGVGVVLLPMRRRRPAAGLSGNPEDRPGEMTALVAETARTIAGARIKTVFRSKSEKERRRAEAIERATANAVEELGNMKGLAMKMGQMMSYFSILPEGAEDTMAVLQSNVPGMDRELVEAVIEQRLGALPHKVFDKFDLDPIGAASIGQVHRARLHDGRDVAVKVQYPGVAEAYQQDLKGMLELASMSASASKLDTTEFMNILVNSFEAELDYDLEARSQRRLHDLYRNHPFVVIPEPIEELCGPRILVSELIHGVKFGDTLAFEQDRRDDLGEIMYRFALGCIMNGFFSGDPHPGNYLFPSGRQACFIDFGMVMDLTAEQAGRVREVIAGGLSGDDEKISHGFRQIGFYPEDLKGVTGRQVWDTLKGVIVGPIDTDEPSRYTRQLYRGSMEEVMKPNGVWVKSMTKAEHVDGWALIWLRYAAGALGTIARLEPQANWRHLLEEIVFGEAPRSDIGKQWGDAPGGAEFINSRFAS